MIHIIGGGTFSHIRNHLALAAPAFGTTAKILHAKFGSNSVLHLTKMAGGELVTNDDVSALLDKLVLDPSTRVIVLNAALCDFEGHINDTPSGKYATRLKTSEGNQTVQLIPAAKLIGKIRQSRKDIFVVGFKTTAGASSDEQYRVALDMLKANSVNLVLANDTITRNNMIVAPEETRYFETKDRDEVLDGLVTMVRSRMNNTFTRSTVVDGDLVDFQQDTRIPDNLRTVINHITARGGYKPFRNATAGHFAVRLGDGSCLTSRRKTNYTLPGGLDLVEIEYDGANKVIAHGAKPSVGGQSQRLIFNEHPDADCIAHFHCPLRPNAPDAKLIGRGSQMENECGSFQCAQNTSRNLTKIGEVKAVMLEDHGPNIVFSRDVPAEHIIDFIESNFDLNQKTGGLVAA